MDVRMLGPLEVVVDGEPVSIGGPRIRRLLASIVLADGSVRSIDSLIDAVWAGEDAPDGARRTLMSYVSRLRAAVGDGLVEQIEPGYRLHDGRVSTDVDAFERLVADAQRTLRVGNHTHAAAIFDEALALWRGEPLAEFAGEHWAEPERARLSTLHLTALEGSFACRIELGDHAEVLPGLERAANDHPERERLQYLHMLALYRSGQQTEALARYETARRHLAEMGLEPSPELRELEYRILTHEEALEEQGPEPGSVVRGYRLGDRLGEGSFGTIYHAVQPSVGRDVAVKVVRPELANDPRFVRRFETEAQLVARLEHPHIVPLYDYWREPGGAFLVMRLLRGGSAEDLLAADGPLPLDAVAQIVDEIGGALAAAHARGVIHRDVKPGNILFDDDRQAYLADFGIAVRADDHPAGSELRSAGSLPYASPEQVRGGDASVESDVYAFGVTIYELLVGRAALPVDSVDAMPEPGPAAPVPRVAADRPDLPPTVDTVLAQATAVDPDRRFASVAELVLAFRSALSPEADIARHHPTAGPEPAPPSERRARRLSGDTLGDVELGSMNPYKGLRAFQEADAQDFFGRDQLVAALLERVEQRRLVAVVGASGSGKSSLVRAGLVPRVQDRNWFAVAMVPGTHPLEELEDALLRIATGEVPGLLEQLTSSHRGILRAVRRVLPPDGSELLLVIDQFEEVFTHADAEQREAFVGGLVQAVSDDRSRVRVVVTVRADFFDRPLRHRQFGELLQDAMLNVLPMSHDELIAAIDRPAARLGARFEPGLVDAIIADVGEGSGVLPLLQYALTELYEHRVGTEMTLARYREIGGVTGALAQRAEDVYSRLDADDRRGARRLFMRLVTPGEGVEDTRRRALRSELTVCSDAVIDAFGDHRLLSFDRDPATRAPTVEVAHEALIREWQRLRDWLDDDRQGLRMLRHLTTAARAWNEADRDPGELYRGGRLAAALEWASGREGDLAPSESEFLDASRALRDAELDERAERIAQRERQHRRLRRSLAGLAVVTVLALVATFVALQQRGRASDRADEAALARAAAETRRLVSDAGQLAPTNRRVALLLAAEAYRREPGASTLGAVKDVLTASTDILGYIGADIAFNDVAWTSDGRIVGTHFRGVVVISGDGREERRIEAAGADGLAVRNDDRVVAVARSGGTVDVLDLGSGDSIATLDHGTRVEALAFSGDGRLLVTGDRRGVVRVYDGRFELVDEVPVFVDVDPRALPGVPPPLPHDPASFREGVAGVATSADGSVVGAIGGSELVMWSTGSGQLRRIPVTTDQGGRGERLSVPSAVGFAVIDGQERLVVAEVYSASIHDVGSGERLDRWTLTSGTTQLAVRQSIAFTTDTIVSSLDDGKVRIVRSDGSASELDSQLASLAAVAASPTGDRVVVAGGEGALVMSTIGRGLISRTIRDVDRQDLSVSDDGRAVVATQIGGVGSRLWRSDGDGYREAPIPSSDGDYALTGFPHGFTYDEDERIFRLRDGATMEPIGPPIGPTGGVTNGVSPDGRLLALGGTRLTGDDGVLAAWVYDSRSGALVATLDDVATDSSQTIRTTRFSPDGSRLLVTTDDGRASLYDTRTWQLTEPLLSAGDDAVVQGAFSLDGSMLATIAGDGTITIRDPVTLQPDGPPLLGNTDGVEGFSYGPFFTDDGRWLITSADGGLRLFDVTERELVGGPFPRRGTPTSSASWNGRYGVTAVDEVAIVWELDPDRWPAIACQAAGRNLTLDEWAQFGPAGEPYRATCEQWPSLSEPPDGG